MADTFYTRLSNVADFMGDIGSPGFSKNTDVPGNNALYAQTTSAFKSALYNVKNSKGQTALEVWAAEVDAITAVIGSITSPQVVGLIAAPPSTIDLSKLPAGSTVITITDNHLPVKQEAGGKLTLVKLPAKYAEPGAHGDMDALYVRDTIALRLVAALDAIHAQGLTQVRAISGYRTYGYQFNQFVHYVKCYPGTATPILDLHGKPQVIGSIAGPPTTGRHRMGEAVDLYGGYYYDTIVRVAMNNQGLYNRLGSTDNDHWSLTGY